MGKKNGWKYSNYLEWRWEVEEVEVQWILKKLHEFLVLSQNSLSPPGRISHSQRRCPFNQGWLGGQNYPENLSLTYLRLNLQKWSHSHEFWDMFWIFAGMHTQYTPWNFHIDTENGGPKNAISISKNCWFWASMFQFQECILVLTGGSPLLPHLGGWTLMVQWVHPR